VGLLEPNNCPRPSVRIGAPLADVSVMTVSVGSEWIERRERSRTIAVVGLGLAVLVRCAVLVLQGAGLVLLVAVVGLVVAFGAVLVLRERRATSRAATSRWSVYLPGWAVRRLNLPLTSARTDRSLLRGELSMDAGQVSWHATGAHRADPAWGWTADLEDVCDVHLIPARWRLPGCYLLMTVNGAEVAAWVRHATDLPERLTDR
jgi:hypothetical protein